MNCNLCPRKCNTDRNIKKGYCNTSMEIVASRASLHMWEEPCISGTNGSGTVFFCGCNLKCVYCQNKEISLNKTGKKITVDRLAEIFLELQAKGAHNINLVTPTHFALQIIDAVKIAKKKGLVLPVVYNCGGYESIETLKALENTVDVYLTDFKYYYSALGKKYSGAEDYPFVAKAALDEMVKNDPVWAELRAVKEDNVIFLEKGLFHNKPNKRYQEAYTQMAGYLYPDYEF